MTPYFEVIEMNNHKLVSHIYDDMKEAVKMGRYFAQKSKREVLLRKVTDLAYLSADNSECISVEWRLLNAIKETYTI